MHCQTIKGHRFRNILISFDGSAQVEGSGEENTMFPHCSAFNEFWYVLFKIGLLIRLKFMENLM
jgi:hypothetical protein